MVGIIVFIYQGIVYVVNMVDGGWRFVSNWEFGAGILNEIVSNLHLLNPILRHYFLICGFLYSRILRRRFLLVVVVLCQIVLHMFLGMVRSLWVHIIHKLLA